MDWSRRDQPIVVVVVARSSQRVRFSLYSVCVFLYWETTTQQQSRSATGKLSIVLRILFVYIRIRRCVKFKSWKAHTYIRIYGLEKYSNLRIREKFIIFNFNIKTGWPEFEYYNLWEINLKWYLLAWQNLYKICTFKIVFKKIMIR